MRVWLNNRGGLSKPQGIFRGWSNFGNKKRFDEEEGLFRKMESNN